MKLREKSSAEDQWKMATTKEKEFLVEYKFRKSLPEGVSQSDYPYLISILWKYDADASSGLPLDEENEQLTDIDAVLDKMDALSNGALMAMVKGNGRREWILYVNDPQVWLKNWHKAIKGHPDYPLEIHQYEEPEWNIWHKLINVFK